MIEQAKTDGVVTEWKVCNMWVCMYTCIHACVSMCVYDLAMFLCAQDMHRQSSDDDLTSVTELAYFEGDFWPNVIEEQIKELDQEVAMYNMCVQCVYIFMYIHTQ